jgi:hypothetical protein
MNNVNLFTILMQILKVRSFTTCANPTLNKPMPIVLPQTHLQCELRSNRQRTTDYQTRKMHLLYILNKIIHVGKIIRNHAELIPKEKVGPALKYNTSRHSIHSYQDNWS